MPDVQPGSVFAVALIVFAVLIRVQLKKWLGE
jgi:hypothetical protein